MPDERWLQRFHDGDRQVIEKCYRDHFETVDRSVSHIVSSADRDTIIHEVFYRLLTRREVRVRFQGGSLGAWLGTVARNQAIDHVRRFGREVSVTPAIAAELAEAEQAAEPTASERALAARMLLEEFRRR